MLSVTLRDSVWRTLDHAAYEIRMRPFELARVILNITVRENLFASILDLDRAKPVPRRILSV